MPLPFQQVNVFSENRLLGNPLAVVKCETEPSDEQMAQFAKWTNLSETTFLLPPRTQGCDYFVRIWTPTGELPFAGHPTLGTAHVWLNGGDQREIVQECGVGKIQVRKSDKTLAFRAPPCKFTPIDTEINEKTRAALGLEEGNILDSQVLDNGPVFYCFYLENSQLVTSVVPDWSKFPMQDMFIGLCGLRPDGDLEVRMIEVEMKTEDPITGSLNAALAMWLLEKGTMKGSYTAHQGYNIGRDGVIAVDREGSDIWIGGHVQTIVEGTVEL